MHPTSKRNKKPLNRWIGEALQSDKFSELCVAKPLESGSKGENFFCVPRLVRTRLAERLRIVLIANPPEGYGIFIENMLIASEISHSESPKAA